MAVGIWAVTAAAGLILVLHFAWYTLHALATSVLETFLENLLEVDADSGGFFAKLKPTALAAPLLAPLRALRARLGTWGSPRQGVLEALYAFGEEILHGAGSFGFHAHVDAAESAPDEALRLGEASTRQVSSLLEYYIPMRLELVAFRKLRFRIRILDLLLGRPGGVRLHVFGLRIRLLATRHQDWSAKEYVEWIQQWHQYHADLAWRLLRGVHPFPKRSLLRSILGFFLDSIVDGHGIWITDVHIIVQIPRPDPVPTERDVPDLTFGIVAEDFVFANAELVPLCKAPTTLPRAAKTDRDTEELRSESRDRIIRDSDVPPSSEYNTTEGYQRHYKDLFRYRSDFNDTLNLPAHRIAGFEVKIYLDCHMDTPFQPCDYWWTMQSFSLQLELPSIFRTWGTSGSRGPAYSPLFAFLFGPKSSYAQQGKRLRVAGSVKQMTLDIKEPQLNAFLYESLKAVGVWERSGYWHHIQEKYFRQTYQAIETTMDRHLFVHEYLKRQALGKKATKSSWVRDAVMYACRRFWQPTPLEEAAISRRVMRDGVTEAARELERLLKWTDVLYLRCVAAEYAKTQIPDSEQRLRMADLPEVLRLTGVRSRSADAAKIPAWDFDRDLLATFVPGISPTFCSMATNAIRRRRRTHYALVCTLREIDVAGITVSGFAMKLHDGSNADRLKHSWGGRQRCLVTSSKTDTSCRILLAQHLDRRRAGFTFEKYATEPELPFLRAEYGMHGIHVVDTFGAHVFSSLLDYVGNDSSPKAESANSQRFSTWQTHVTYMLFSRPYLLPIRDAATKGEDGKDQQATQLIASSSPRMQLDLVVRDTRWVGLLAPALDILGVVIDSVMPSSLRAVPNPYGFVFDPQKQLPDSARATLAEVKELLRESLGSPRIPGDRSGQTNTRLPGSALRARRPRGSIDLSSPLIRSSNQSQVASSRRRNRATLGPPKFERRMSLYPTPQRVSTAKAELAFDSPNSDGTVGPPPVSVEDDDPTLHDTVAEFQVTQTRKLHRLRSYSWSPGSESSPEGDPFHDANISSHAEEKNSSNLGLDDPETEDGEASPARPAPIGTFDEEEVPERRRSSALLLCGRCCAVFIHLENVQIALVASPFSRKGNALLLVMSSRVALRSNFLFESLQIHVKEARMGRVVDRRRRSRNQRSEGSRESSMKRSESDLDLSRPPQPDDVDRSWRNRNLAAVGRQHILCPTQIEVAYVGLDVSPRNPGIGTDPGNMLRPAYFSELQQDVSGLMESAQANFHSDKEGKDAPLGFGLHTEALRSWGIYDDQSNTSVGTTREAGRNGNDGEPQQERPLVVNYDGEGIDCMALGDLIRWCEEDDCSSDAQQKSGQYAAWAHTCVGIFDAVRDSDVDRSDEPPQENDVGRLGISVHLKDGLTRQAKVSSEEDNDRVVTPPLEEQYGRMVDEAGGKKDARQAMPHFQFEESLGEHSEISHLPQSEVEEHRVHVFDGLAESPMCLGPSHLKPQEARGREEERDRSDGSILVVQVFGENGEEIAEGFVPFNECSEVHDRCLFVGGATYAGPGFWSRFRVWDCIVYSVDDRSKRWGTVRIGVSVDSRAVSIQLSGQLVKIWSGTSFSQDDLAHQDVDVRARSLARGALRDAGRWSELVPSLSAVDALGATICHIPCDGILPDVRTSAEDDYFPDLEVAPSYLQQLWMWTPPAKDESCFGREFLRRLLPQQARFSGHNLKADPRRSKFLQFALSFERLRTTQRRRHKSLVTGASFTLDEDDLEMFSSDRELSRTASMTPREEEEGRLPVATGIIYVEELEMLNLRVEEKALEVRLVSGELNQDLQLSGKGSHSRKSFYVLCAATSIPIRRTHFPPPRTRFRLPQKLLWGMDLGAKHYSGQHRGFQATQGRALVLTMGSTIVRTSGVDMLTLQKSVDSLVLGLSPVGQPDSAAEQRARGAKERHRQITRKRLDALKRTIVEAFNQCDVDGNGTLDREELAELVFQLQQDHNFSMTRSEMEAEIRALVAFTDIDGDEKISLDELQTTIQRLYDENIDADSAALSPKKPNYVDLGAGAIPAKVGDFCSLSVVREILGPELCDSRGFRAPQPRYGAPGSKHHHPMEHIADESGLDGDDPSGVQVPAAPNAREGTDGVEDSAGEHDFLMQGGITSFASMGRFGRALMSKYGRQVAQRCQRVMEEDAGLEFPFVRRGTFPEVEFSSARIRLMQRKLVRALRHARFAQQAWEFLYVPSIFGLPIVTRLQVVATRKVGIPEELASPSPLAAPLGIGTRVFIDDADVVITSLPDRWQGMHEDLDSGDGYLSGNGEESVMKIGFVPLVGIATLNEHWDMRDAALLSFEVDRPCIVYVCVDSRHHLLKRRYRNLPGPREHRDFLMQSPDGGSMPIPIGRPLSPQTWLLERGYQWTGDVIMTSVGPFEVFQKIVHRSVLRRSSSGNDVVKRPGMRAKVVLGGNEGVRHHYRGNSRRSRHNRTHNYFVVIAALDEDSLPQAHRHTDIIQPFQLPESPEIRWLLDDESSAGLDLGLGFRSGGLLQLIDPSARRDGHHDMGLHILEERERQVHPIPGSVSVDDAGKTKLLGLDASKSEDITVLFAMDVQIGKLSAQFLHLEDELQLTQGYDSVDDGFGWDDNWLTDPPGKNFGPSPLLDLDVHEFRIRGGVKHISEQDILGPMDSLYVNLFAQVSLKYLNTNRATLRSPLSNADGMLSIQPEPLIEPFPVSALAYSRFGVRRTNFVLNLEKHLALNITSAFLTEVKLLERAMRARKLTSYSHLASLLVPNREKLPAVELSTFANPSNQATDETVAEDDSTDNSLGLDLDEASSRPVTPVVQRASWDGYVIENLLGCLVEVRIAQGNSSLAGWSRGSVTGLEAEIGYATAVPCNTSKRVFVPRSGECRVTFQIEGFEPIPDVQITPGVSLLPLVPLDLQTSDLSRGARHPSTFPICLAMDVKATKKRSSVRNVHDDISALERSAVNEVLRRDSMNMERSFDDQPTGGRLYDSALSIKLRTNVTFVNQTRDALEIAQVHHEARDEGNREYIPPLHIQDDESGAFPLPLLQQSVFALRRNVRLYAAGDDTLGTYEETSADVQLPLSLFDSTIPAGLRRTPSLEENALHMDFTSREHSKVVERDQGSAKGSAKGAVHGSIPRSTSSEAGLNRKVDSFSSLGSFDAAQALATEWRITALPAYKIYNSLPYAVEWDFRQPGPKSESSLGSSGGRANNGKMASSDSRMNISNTDDAVMDLFFLPDPTQARRYTSDGGTQQRRLDPELLNPSNEADFGGSRQTSSSTTGFRRSKTLRPFEARALFLPSATQDAELAYQPRIIFRGFTPPFSSVSIPSFFVGEPIAYRVRFVVPQQKQDADPVGSKGAVPYNLVNEKGQLREESKLPEVEYCAANGSWSEPIIIPEDLHGDRKAFHQARHGANTPHAEEDEERFEEVLMYPGNSDELAPFHRAGSEMNPRLCIGGSIPQTRMQRMWPLSSSRGLVLYATHWIMNKSGLHLSFRCSPEEVTMGGVGSSKTFGMGFQRPLGKGEPLVQGFKPGEIASADLHRRQNKEMMETWERMHGLDLSADGLATSEALAFDYRAERPQSDLDNDFFFQAASETGSLPSLAKKLPIGRPILFSSPRTNPRLQVLPLSSSLGKLVRVARFLELEADAGALAYLSQVTGQLSVQQEADGGDSQRKVDVKLRHSPETVKATAFRELPSVTVGDPPYSDCGIRLMELPACLKPRRPDEISCLQVPSALAEYNNSLSTHPNALPRPIFSFSTSHDAYLYVCVDAQCKRPPRWMILDGYRSTGERVHCTGASRYLVYRRFVRAGVCVRIGPNPEKMAPLEQPRAQFMMILFCVCATNAQEVCVERVELRRSGSEVLFSTAQPALLFDVSPGEHLYSDREYVLRSMPEQLQQMRPALLQTCQSDRRSTSLALIRLWLPQTTAVLVAIDSRSPPPVWLKSRGWQESSLSLPGVTADYSYLIWIRVCLPGDPVVLGGASARRHYVVLLHSVPSIPLNPSYALKSFPGDLQSIDRSHASRESMMEFLGSNSEPSSVGAQDDTCGGANSLLFNGPIWTEDEKHGNLSAKLPNLSFQGRSWCEPFPLSANSVDGVATGEIMSKGCCLGLQIRRLPGFFHRTTAVTLLPRFVVQNRTKCRVQVLPLKLCVEHTMKAKRAAAAALWVWHRSSKTFVKERAQHLRRSGSATQVRNGGSAEGHSAPAELPKYLLRTDGVDRFTPVADVNSGDSVLIYSYSCPLQVTSAWASAFESNPVVVTEKDADTCVRTWLSSQEKYATYGERVKSLYQFEDAREVVLSAADAVAGQEANRCLFFRLADQVVDGSSRYARGAGAESEMPNDLSPPVCVDKLGETHIWLKNEDGFGPVCTVKVRVEEGIVHVILEDVSKNPPFRVENRSAGASLVYRQVGVLPRVWQTLPPMSWAAFVWDNPEGSRKLRIAIQGSEAEAQTYELEKIQALEPLTGAFSPVSDLLVLGASQKEVELFHREKGHESRRTTVSFLRTFDTGRMLQRELQDALYASGVLRGRQSLVADVRAEGRTRVLAISDVRPFDIANLLNTTVGVHRLRLRALSKLKRLYNSFDISFRGKGLALTLIDSHGGVQSSAVGGQELMTLTADGLELRKKGGTDRTELSVFHIQIDDIRRKARFPVVLRPVDTGFNSHLRGSAGNSTEPLPFLRVMYERELTATKIQHFKMIEGVLGRVQIHVDVRPMISLVRFFVKCVSRPTSERDLTATQDSTTTSSYKSFSELDESTAAGQNNDDAFQGGEPRDERKRKPERISGPALKSCLLILNDRLQPLGHVSSGLIYVEHLHHGPIVLQLEILANIGDQNAPGATSLDPAANPLALDSPFSSEDETALALLGNQVLGALTVLVSTFAHASPIFVFGECEVEDFFGQRKDLVRTLTLGLVHQGVAQSYKLFGSMEVLGDPLSLANKVGEGMVQFFRATGAELRGESDFKGEGLRRLAQGVVGGAAQSASKISGTLEEMISGLGLQLGPDHMVGSDGTIVKKPRHIGEGVVEGGKVMITSLTRGVLGLYDHPALALRNDEGVAGFVGGVGKGLAGLVVSPVAGVLGAFRTVTASVDATLHFWDLVPLGQRRPRRLLAPTEKFRDEMWVSFIPEEYLEKDENGNRRMKYLWQLS